MFEKRSFVCGNKSRGNAFRTVRLPDGKIANVMSRELFDRAVNRAVTTPSPRPAKPLTLGSHIWMLPASIFLAGVIAISVACGLLVSGCAARPDRTDWGALAQGVGHVEGTK